MKIYREIEWRLNPVNASRLLSILIQVLSLLTFLA